MMKGLVVAWLLPAVFAAGSVMADEGDFRTLNDIESELDPLEFSSDYDGVRSSIDLTIDFDFDSSSIKPEAKEQLDALGKALTGERLGAYRFRIIGHTDGVGSDHYNQQLSERRARAVVIALIEQYGVPAGRLVSEGAGFSEAKKGLAPDAAKHRRVEVRTIHETDQNGDRKSDLDGLGGTQLDDWNI